MILGRLPGLILLRDTLPPSGGYRRRSSDWISTFFGIIDDATGVEADLARRLLKKKLETV